MAELEKVVVTVSQHTVFLAEAAIRQCGSCSNSPGVPFARILKMVSCHTPEDADYILPVLGMCPYCQAELNEESIVIPKHRR